MKTITFEDTPLNLSTAIRWLETGRCLGIKPGKNSNYTTLHIPERGGPRLVWSGGMDSAILIEQIRGDWFPVVVDHLTLTKS